MEHLFERLLNPGVLIFCIPVLAVLFWGVTSVIRALRHVPEEEEVEDFATWKAELEQLRSRVDRLEQALGERRS